MNYIALVVTLGITQYIDAKITLTKYEMCDPLAKYQIRFANDIKNENGKQIIEEGSLTTDIDIDSHIMNEIEVLLFNAKEGKYVSVTTIKDTFCNILTNYMGDFGSALLDSAGLENCHISKGVYKVSNHEMDFEKMKFKNFPAGSLRFETHIRDGEKGPVLGCTRMDLTVEV